MRLLKAEKAELSALLESGEYDLDGLTEVVYEKVYRMIQQRQTLHAVAVKSLCEHPIFFGPYITKVEAKKAAGLFAHAGSITEVGRLRPPIQEEE